MTIRKSFTLEWLKLKHYRVFWILFALYLLAQLTITSGGVFFLNVIDKLGADFNGIKMTMIPIYDFPDIWQNTAYMASFGKILIAFIVIISVINDFSYNTIRQNIIDGMSKKEFILSKILMIFFLAGICSILLFLSSLITGFVYSSTLKVSLITTNLEFILAFFVQTVLLSMFAFCIAIVIKKSGFAIVALFLYSIFFEPMIGIIFDHVPIFENNLSSLTIFMPIYAINALIEVPFQRYFFQEIKDYVLWYEWAIVFFWFVIFTLFIFYRIQKKDLKGA